MFLSDEGFALAEKLAARAEQVDLDQDQVFIPRYVGSMRLTPDIPQAFVTKSTKNG